jgi:hypothetical protein
MESAQSKIYAHWLSGGQLAFAFGLDLVWEKVVLIVAKVAAVPMSQIDGWWGWALW